METPLTPLASTPQNPLLAKNLSPAVSQTPLTETAGKIQQLKLFFKEISGEIRKIFSPEQVQIVLQKLQPVSEALRADATIQNLQGMIESAKTKVGDAKNEIQGTATN